MNNEKIKAEYPALSRISIIFKVLGIAILVLSIIVFIYGITLLDRNSTESKGLYLIISSIASVLIFSLLFFSFSELIPLFIRIELNSRKAMTEPQKETKIYSKLQKDDINKTNMTFEEWKKMNPRKSINDYYAAISRKD